jgi:hypothetical protein
VPCSAPRSCDGVARDYGHRNENFTCRLLRQEKLNGTPAHLAPSDPCDASLLASEQLYRGRIIQTRDGEWKLLAFENKEEDASFVRVVSDPIPVSWNANDPVPTSSREPEWSDQ